MKPRGRIIVDAGAVAALEAGSSLLPAGVSAIEGRFGRGDPVQVRAQDGRVLGQGLTRYDAEEAAKILGLRTDAIAEALGYAARGALIHRDDMAF